jgi:lipoprotein NlpI
MAYEGRGEAYHGQGDYDRAIADFEQVIGLDPKYVMAYNNRALAYYVKGNIDHAIVDYDQSIKLDPKNATAFNGRGSAYEAKGDHERAIADYDQAIWLNSEYSNAHFGRGIANFYAGSLAKSLADFNRANELDPGNAYVALWIDIVRKRSDQQSDFAKVLTRIDLTKWPAPIVRLYLHQITAETVLVAANDGDAKTRKGRLCEFNFYSGELALQGGSKDDAARLLRLAAADCPKSFAEFIAANAELKKLGTTR